MSEPSAASDPPVTQLILCDRRAEVVDAWRQQFDECPEVDIREGDILECGAEALVVPGNAFGFLDRGLELEVCETLGWEIQDALRAEVRGRFHGELLVGQACFTPGKGPFHQILYTCLYRTPRKLRETVNAFLAVRGAFLALGAPGAPAPRSVAIPGLGTGSSDLHPLISARQLRYAYEIFSGRRGFGDKNLSQLARRERKLATLPRSALETPDSESSP
ncbi:MAG: hypothetical protein O7J95_05180 [Planctomycetota bacterium]|nr:hypothetical protein [Planctomycetota bacterium]